MLGLLFLTEPTQGIQEMIQKYRDLDQKDIPLTESLKDTVIRFKPYWHEVISPILKTGMKTLISAHGNNRVIFVKTAEYGCFC